MFDAPTDGAMPITPRDACSETLLHIYAMHILELIAPQYVPPESLRCSAIEMRHHTVIGQHRWALGAASAHRVCVNALASRRS